LNIEDEQLIFVEYFLNLYIFELKFDIYTII